MGLKHTIKLEFRSGSQRHFHFSTRRLLGVLGVVAAGCLVAFSLGWVYVTKNAAAFELSALESENDALRQENSALEGDLQQLASRVGEFEDRSEDLALIAGIDVAGQSRLGAGGDELNVIDGRIMELEGTFDDLEAALRSRRQRLASTPTLRPVIGLITSSYGTRRDPLTGGRARHTGIDIGALPGRPVVAAADGVVTRAGRINALGKAVYVSHGYGTVTRYGHLSKFVVEPGQKVRRGETVGYVGNTGRTTGYHLHYEVRIHGRAVNPLDYMIADYESAS